MAILAGDKSGLAWYNLLLENMNKEQTSPKKNFIPLQVGVTGGIGTGKSTVCKIFESIGIPIYDADNQAKTLMVENPELRSRIIDLLGSDSYLENGLLNKAYIAKIVFKDSEKLKQLNRIVHPAVIMDGIKWHQSQHRVPYTIKEAALMIESGSYKSLDKLILVTAPLELRIRRVMKRDNISRDEVLSRIEKQLPEKEKMAFAEFIIRNDGSESLVKQVFGIHQQLKQLATLKLQ